jgi:putative flippase GtrA
VIKRLLNRELVRYFLAGISAVIVDLAVYLVLIHYTTTDPSTAKKYSFIAGGIWAFFINKFFTFRKHAVKLKEPFLFILVYLIGFLLNSVIHNAVLASTGITLLSFICATFVSVVWNYAGQKWIVFRKATQ